MLAILLIPLVIAALYYSSRAIFSQLGSPFSRDNAMKWGLLFLVAVVIYQAAPQAIQAIFALPLPSPDALALAIPLGYGVLAFYGYVNLRRDFFEPRERGQPAEERLLPRQRATPPPPTLQPAAPARNGAARFHTVDDEGAPPRA